MNQFWLIGLFSLLHTSLLPGQNAADSDAQPMIVNAHAGPEYGKPIPFTRANVLRLLRAGHWVQAQIDALASNRAIHRRNV